MEYKLRMLKAMLKVEQEETARNGSSYGAHLTHWWGGQIKPINLDAEAIQCLIDHYTKRLGADAQPWVLTDDDSCQYVRPRSKWVFELIEFGGCGINRYAVYSGRVDMTRFLEDKESLAVLNGILESYDYDSLEHFINDQLNEEWIELAAECVFETFINTACPVEGGCEVKVLMEWLTEDEAREYVRKRIGQTDVKE